MRNGLPTAGRANSSLNNKATTNDKVEKSEKPLGFEGFGGIVGVSAGGASGANPIPNKKAGSQSATNPAKKKDDPKGGKTTPANKDSMNVNGGGGLLSIVGSGVTGTGMDQNI